MGKKDIIKIVKVIDINFDALGYVDSDVTVNIIRDGKLAKRQNIDIPERIENVIKCKNPRCITTVEQGLKHIFVLSDKENKIYRCMY
jgi:aspartate carbamoyltransferase regulatory subunit